MKCGMRHLFFDILVMPQVHAKHSEMSLVPALVPRKMGLAMISWNVCQAP